jgi:hypothetical protein
MNSFSHAQWDSMGKRSFESKMTALIRKNHPQQAADIDDAGLIAEIHRQVARAARHEMVDELSAATYVYAAWLLGPAFDERIPSLTQILRSPDMSPLAKANALNNFLLTVFHALDTSKAGEARS